MPFADPEKAREYRRAYYQRPEVKQKVKEYVAKPEVKAKLKIYQRKYWRTHRCQQEYGLTYEQYQKMLEAQNFSCKICGKNGEANGKGLNVDHCHETGKIRGLLCTRCNTSLGHFEDSPELLIRAANYLKGLT